MSLILKAPVRHVILRKFFTDTNVYAALQRAKIIVFCLKLKNFEQVLRYVLFFLTIIALDQGTKYLAVQYLTFYEPCKINALLNFTLAQNTGAAFSFLDAASGWQTPFFVFLNSSISVILLCWLYRSVKTAPFKSWSLSLIIGGAVGNIIDRLRCGFVIDFIDVHWKAYHWPIFNVADSAICVGIFLLLVAISHEEN